MKRWLLNLLTALSLLLCVPVVALWVRGLARSDLLIHSDGRLRVWNLRSSSGELWVVAVRFPAGTDYVARTTLKWISDNRRIEIAKSRLVNDTFWARRGFAFTTSPMFVVSVPDWLLAAAFAPLPTAWLIRWMRCWADDRRLRGNVCTRCGYDLRATPDRCPECGHTPAGVTA